MGSKTFIVALSLSFVCLASAPAAKASSITVGTDYFMTVQSYPSPVEQNSDGYDVGDTTINIYADNSGTKGALIATYVDEAFCIDFLDHINVPATYVVVAQGLGSAYNSALGGPSNATLELEAALGYQFNGTQSHDATVQDAIWDQSGASYHSSSITSALTTAGTYSGGYVGDFAFEEVSDRWGADGQSFMVDVPQTPSPTPEPSSLILLGTGLLGVAGGLRRRIGKA